MTRHKTLRAVTSAIAMVAGAVLVGVSLVSHWLDTSIADSDNFTEIYADLPSDPLFQNIIASNISAFVEEQIAESGVGTATSSIMGGLSGLLDLVPGASDWAEQVDAVPENLLESIGQMINSEVVSMLSSPGFKPVWRTSLHEVHSQLINTLNGESSVTYIDGEPHLMLDMGPLVAALKQTLMDEGAWYATFIPEVTGELPIVAIQDLPALQSTYQLLGPADTYTPYLAGALLVLAVAIAPRRFTALGFAGLSVLAVSVALMLAAPRAAGHYFQAMGSIDTRLLSTKLWNMATAPLMSATQITLWVAAGVTLVGIVGAIIVAATYKPAPPQAIDVVVETQVS